MSTTCWAA